MEIKERIKKVIDIKNISNLLFFIMFFNITFLGYSFFFNSFNYIYLLGNIVIIILFLINKITSKKIDILINLGILILISILFIIFFNEYVLGFKISLNNIFNTSQSLSNYKYQYFEINALIKDQKLSLFYFNLINSFLYSMIVLNLFKLLKGYLLLILNIPFIILSIYFEVSFNNIIVILLILINISYILLNIYFNSKGYNKSSNKLKIKNISILLSFSLILGESFSLISKNYNESNNILNISTSIRDYFNNPINEKDNSNTSNNSSSDSDNQNNTSSESDSKDEAGKTVSRIPILLIVLIGIFSILLIIPILLIIKEKIKKYKNKKLLDSEDIKTLVKSNYLESVKILRKLGIKYQNKGYLEYLDDLKEYDKKYQELYLKASNIYLKSSYSDNFIRDEEVKIIKDFYNSTLNELYIRTKGIKKIYWRIVK